MAFLASFGMVTLSGTIDVLWYCFLAVRICWPSLALFDLVGVTAARHESVYGRPVKILAASAACSRQHHSWSMWLSWVATSAAHVGSASVIAVVRSFASALL